MGRFEWYQYPLIALGLIASLFLGVFLYREIYPEYRIYQNDYIALEQFRSTYTNTSPLNFKKGSNKSSWNAKTGARPLSIAVHRAMWR